MKKKEYLSPEQEIVDLKLTTPLLAGSTGFDDGEEEYTPGEGGGRQPV